MGVVVGRRTLAAAREESPAVLEELAGHFEEVFGLVHGWRLVFRRVWVGVGGVLVVGVRWCCWQLNVWRFEMGTAVGGRAGIRIRSWQDPSVELIWLHVMALRTSLLEIVRV